MEQSRGELQQGDADLIESRLEAQRLQLQTNQREWEQRKAQTDLDAAQAATERLAERRGELRRYAREELGTDDLQPARADVPVSRLERRVGELRRMLKEIIGPNLDIPAPDELVFISWFEGGEVFRSCCTFRRGKGKIVYFRPGHETFPIYFDARVQRVIANAVGWAAPTGSPYFGNGRQIREPLSPIAAKHVVDEKHHQAE